MISTNRWFVTSLFAAAMFIASWWSLPLAASAQEPSRQGAPARSADPTPTPTPAESFTVAGQPDWSPPRDYSDFLRKYYRVFKVEKRLCKKLSADRVFIGPPISAPYELVREDAEFYYIRNLPLEDPESHLHKEWVAQNLNEVIAQEREAYMRDKYIIVDEPDIYPPFTDKLDFARSDTGLPKVGRWVRSFDVADMNGDGLADLVLPPQRMGNGRPSIFLQQKDHTWRLWENTRWPGKENRLDYGTVRVADFNGDGHPDIAIASHFLPAYVLYGAGKGHFTKVERLPVLNSDVTAQALTVADFNGDGRPDIALEAELDIQMGVAKRFKSGLVNVLLNLPTGWKAIGDDFPTEIFGYGLTTADVERDGSTDLILTSREQGVRDLVWHNSGKGEKWDPIGSRLMPFNSFVFSVAAGPLDRFPDPDLLVCYQQNNPREKELPTQACTIYRFHDENGKPLAEPKPQLLLKTKVQYDIFTAVAIGDIDGDGRSDIAVVTSRGNLRVLLQLPDGQFYEQRSPAFDLGENTAPTDVRIADLFGDGKGEIIVMGTVSSDKATSGGGVWVFAPRPKAPVTAKSGP